VSVTGEPLEDNVKVGVYFILSELMTNAVKHAPGSAIAVRAAMKGAELVLEVTDTGPGGANPLGSGLRGVAGRVSDLSGSFTISSPPNDGTRVLILLPLPSPPPPPDVIRPARPAPQTSSQG
jgi:signal transduction histidine kinase